MTKKYLFAILPLFMSVICFLGYRTTSSTITPDGLLIEPGFFLIPVGYLFLFISIIVFISFGISTLITSNRKKNFL